MSMTLEELDKTITDLTPPDLLYQVSASVPHYMDFGGEERPGFVLMPSYITMLDSDLLIFNPALEEELIYKYGNRMRPVTADDWQEANARKLLQFRAELRLP